MLAGFTVENYRAFARRQDIEIRPLTLFYGWNSSGKSALVRFLPLLAESIRIAGPPIYLSGEVGRRATWPELVCRANERLLLRIGLRWWDDMAFTADWDISGDSAGGWQEIEQLDTSLGLESSRWTVSAVPRRGLMPEAPSGGAADLHFDALGRVLGELASNVQWISGLRARPERLISFSGGPAPTIAPDGRNALDHLIAAQLRSTVDPLLQSARRLFAALGEEFILDNPMVGAWRMLLHPAGLPRAGVNLCDTGEGYAQVLPVLVALARATVGGPRILCLEQPELHLHTRAQAELAALLVDSISAPTRPSLLVETHSEVLLTSVQLAIARQPSLRDSVRVYWVESNADGTSDAIAVDFDDKGRPLGTTITGAFDDAIRLGRDLIVAQLAGSVS